MIKFLIKTSLLIVAIVFGLNVLGITPIQAIAGAQEVLATRNDTMADLQAQMDSSLEKLEEVTQLLE